MGRLIVCAEGKGIRILIQGNTPQKVRIFWVSHKNITAFSIIEG
jgi:hypothetical protein